MKYYLSYDIRSDRFNIFNQEKQQVAHAINKRDVYNIKSVLFLKRIKLERLKNYIELPEDVYNLIEKYLSPTIFADISAWDTSKMTNIGNMFKNCHSIQIIEQGRWK